VRALCGLLLLTGCCTVPDKIALGIATMGIYNYACAEREIAEARAEDVEHCVAQGGDPAACRRAVYGEQHRVLIYAP
jgi:hypothetical protein